MIRCLGFHQTHTTLRTFIVPLADEDIQWRPSFKEGFLMDEKKNYC